MNKPANLRFLFVLMFETPENAKQFEETCVLDIEDVYYAEVDERYPKEVRDMYVSIAHENNYVKDIAQSLKTLLTKIQDNPLTGLLTLTYTITQSDAKMLNDMVSVRTHLKELEHTTDKILDSL